MIPFLTSVTARSRLHANCVVPINWEILRVFLILVSLTSCFDQNLFIAFKYMRFHCSLLHELDISWLKNGNSYFPRILLVMKKKPDKTYVNYV